MNLLILLALMIVMQNGLDAQPLSALHQHKTTESKVLVFDDFEDSSTIRHWNGTFSVSDQFPSHGKTGLSLSTKGWQPPLLENEKIPKNWTGFACLKFDIYNPSSGLYFGSIQIFDELATDLEAEINGESYRV